MSQQYDVGCRTFTAGGAIAQYERVKMSGTSVVQAGLTDVGIGIAQRAAASGELVAVKLWNSDGTFKMIAAGAVTAGAVVNTAASGKCDDATTSTSLKLGYALEAAAASGDIFEVAANIALGTTAN